MKPEMTDAWIELDFSVPCIAIGFLVFRQGLLNQWWHALWLLLAVILSLGWLSIIGARIHYMLNREAYELVWKKPINR